MLQTLHLGPCCDPTASSSLCVTAAPAVTTTGCSQAWKSEQQEERYRGSNVAVSAEGNIRRLSGGCSLQFVSGKKGGEKRNKGRRPAASGTRGGRQLPGAAASA